MTLAEQVESAIAGTRYATSRIRDNGAGWDGTTWVGVEYAWDNNARAELVAFLESAFAGVESVRVIDRVSAVWVTQK